MTNVVRYSGASNRGPSTKLWKGNEPRYGEWFNDPGKGFGVFDDFLTFGATANNYTMVLDSGGGATIAPIATEVGGVLRLTTSTTDNNEAYLGYGLATSVLGKVDAGAGACGFEARVRFGSVADNANGFFVGMAEEGFIAANAMVDDTAALVDKDFIGFTVLQADGNAVRAVHNTASGGGIVVVAAAALAPVVDTWYKLGWWFDGISKLTYFVDGVAVGTVLESDAKFPDGEELTFVLGAKTGSTTSVLTDIDWWAFAQEAA